MAACLEVHKISVLQPRLLHLTRVSCALLVIFAAELEKQVTADQHADASGPELAQELAAVEEHVLQLEAAPEATVPRGSRRRTMAASEHSTRQQQQTKKRIKQATLVTAGKKHQAGTTGKAASPAGPRTRRGLRSVTGHPPTINHGF